MENEEIVVLNSDKYPTKASRARTKKRDPDVERPKIKPVARARRVKRPFYAKFVDAFRDGGAANEVGDYIIYDVVVPAAKTTIADLIEGAIDMLLFGGERRVGGVHRVRGTSHIAYNNLYSGSRREDPRSAGHRASARRPHNVEPAVQISRDFRQVVLESRAEAELVMGGLAEILGDYDVVTVADLYDLVGLTADYTDNRFGWYDLPNMRAVRVRNGWAVELPTPKIITE